MTSFSAFIIAIMLSALFAGGYKRATFTALVIFFFLLLLGIIALQYWLVSFGSLWQGIEWLPLLFIALIFVLFLAIPHSYKQKRLKKD